MCGRHFDWVIRDYLYRAKSHATWVIPSFDFDEYFDLNSGNIFPDGKIPQDYLQRTGWDAIARSQNKTPEEVRSISFKRFHFARASMAVWRFLPHGARRISKSAWGNHRGGLAEVRLQRPRGDAWWHWLKDFDPKTARRQVMPMNPDMMSTVVSSVPTEHISINESIGYVHHYRIPHGDPQAKTYDDQLAQDTDKLTEAIEQRFGQKLPALLKRFSEAIPQPAQ